MRITIGGIEVLSQEYRSFSDLLDEYVDYEDNRGRRVPDFEPNIMLTAIALYFLKKAVDELIHEARDWRQRRRVKEDARIRNELEERRHAELLDKIGELPGMIQAAMEAGSPQSALPEEAAPASALLEWATKENVSIEIDLETEAEVDLREAFEAWTRGVPRSSVND